jgi:type I restriction enzyme S subunit
LRFPGFEGEWGKKKLGAISENIKERISSSLLSTNNYISTENLLQNFQGAIPATSIPHNTHVVVFKKGDVLFSNIRPYLKKVWRANRDGGCSADVFVFRSNDACLSQFLYYHIANDIFIDYVMIGAKGVKMPRGDKQQIDQYLVSLPSKQEQEKIATFLSLIDQRIETQIKIIEQYKSLIKGVCQNLFNDKARTKWKNQYLKEVLVERKESNTDNFPIHSVSVSKGVVNQIEYLGRSFAAKDTSKYNVVNYGDIVYTKSPTGQFPYGIIKQSFVERKVAVSPLYGVYKPENFYIANILHHYFSNPINTNNYLHNLIQKGAKNTINITNQNFLEKEIYLPTDESEINKISTLLNSIAWKNILEQSILDNLIQQKTHLLQNLFI